MNTDISITERLLTRLAVEDFLYMEAALLDAWALDEWLALFTDDARYVVPSTDQRDGDPATTLTLIDDDRLRLGWRVGRLKSRHAHREFPYSQTRRIISNVRVTEIDGDEVHVVAGLIVYRFRYGRGDSFIGSYKHTLVRTDDSESFKIRVRRTELDMESLSPNGALSMIF